jgi:UDP-N-acetylmuramoyl-L-alanyl-D-glutamate--2,6-diaminopimelate ligase
MNMAYGFPARGLHIIGVTGTNGKTTTSYLIHKMLTNAGVKSALLSTVAYGVGDDIKPQVEHMTTTAANVLQKRLKQFKKQGVEWVVVETSSHALAQHRVWGLPYEIAVMTNLTRDHLDYHGTFAAYGNAKIQLFKLAAKHGLKLGIANADDNNYVSFIDCTPNHITYGINEGDIRADHIKEDMNHSTYQAHFGKDTYNIRMNIPGRFNIYNSMAAIAVGRALKLSIKEIEDGIASLQGIEGRMNSIDEGQPFKVIVDFASTPDGFERLFETVRPLVKGKLIAVFGSAGRRDESKRAVQGEIAGKNADIVVITEEDDRDVEGVGILREIAEGAKKAGKTEDKDLFLVHNREEAIGYAMTLAKTKDDMVVLLGKGHEKTIERADGVYPWNETEVARTALQALGAKQASK